MSASDQAEYYEDRPGRDLFEYLEIPLRYPRHVLIPVLLVMIAALVLVIFAPRKYRSSSLIIVATKSVPPEYDVTPASSEALAQRVSTVRQVALSRTRLEAIIGKVNPYPENSDEPLHVTVDRMRAAIQIRVQGTDSFMFEYVNRDPYKAMQVTSMLGSQFIEDSERLREGLSEQAFGLLQINLAAARKALEEREQAVRLFEQRNWETLPEQLDSNLRMLQQLQVEQQTLGDSLRTLGERRAVLEASLLDGERLEDAASEGGKGGAEAQLAKLRNSYQSMRSRYTEDHPDMRMLRARIEHFEKVLAGAGEGGDIFADPEGAKLRDALKQVEAEITSVRRRRGELDQTIASFQSRIETTPKTKQAHTSLIRDYPQLREDYNVALRREKDAEMARRLEEFWRYGYFRVLDPAYLPGRPIMPYTTMFLVGGLALGLGLGLLTALAADLLDRSVKTEREVEELLPFPLLVTMPRVDRAPPRGRAATS